MTEQFSWANAAEAYQARRAKLAELREKIEHCPLPTSLGDLIFLTQLFMGEDASRADLEKAEAIIRRLSP